MQKTYQITSDDHLAYIKDYDLQNVRFDDHYKKAFGGRAYAQPQQTLNELKRSMEALREGGKVFFQEGRQDEDGLPCPPFKNIVIYNIEGIDKGSLVTPIGAQSTERMIENLVAHLQLAEQLDQKKKVPYYIWGLRYEFEPSEIPNDHVWNKSGMSLFWDVITEAEKRGLIEGKKTTARPSKNVTCPAYKPTVLKPYSDPFDHIYQREQPRHFTSKRHIALIYTFQKLGRRKRVTSVDMSQEDLLEWANAYLREYEKEDLDGDLTDGQPVSRGCRLLEADGYILRFKNSGNDPFTTYMIPSIFDVDPDEAMEKRYQTGRKPIGPEKSPFFDTDEVESWGDLILKKKVADVISEIASREGGEFLEVEDIAGFFEISTEEELIDYAASLYHDSQRNVHWIVRYFETKSTIENSSIVTIFNNHLDGLHTT